MSYIKQVDQQPTPDFRQPTELLSIGLFQDRGLQAGHKPVDEVLGGLVSKVLERKDFKGKKGERLLLHHDGPLARVALIGLGEPDKFTTDVARQAAGNAVVLAMKHKLTACSLLAFSEGTPAGESDLPAGELAQAMTEGLILGSYKFDAYKKPDEDERQLESLALVGAIDAEGLARGTIIANAVCMSRDLQNHPANVVTPSRLAEEARRIAQAPNMKATVFDRDQFVKLGMGALAGVAAGSDQPAKFMTIEYRGGQSGAAPFALVGKGLTFDAGGISIKPSSKMDEMKFDMSGAATVLGIMEAISQLQPEINIVAAIPSTENLLGGSAQRPGDIVTAYNGKTIEILNTDAEGRLILADALSYVVDKYKPMALIDFATLTGAVLIALGHRASGLMGNNDSLIEEVKAAADKTGERVWQLPMWEEYKEDIKSKVADIRNIGEGRLAGTIAGGMFLQAFVDETPWVHLDIAGTAWQDKDQPYTPGGGSGVAVRMITRILLERAGS